MRGWAISRRRFQQSLAAATGTIASHAWAASVGAAEPTAAVAARWMMSWDDYARGSFAKPYLVELQAAGSGELVYLGVEHSSDPQHPQFAQLSQLWDRLHPQVALHEGQARVLGATLAESIRSGGEPGFVRFRGSADGIAVESMDASIADQANCLLQHHPADLTKLYFALRRIVRHERFAEPTALEPLIKGYLASLAEEANLPGPPASNAELNRVFAHYLPEHGSPSEAAQRWFDPLGRVNRINEMSRALADYRNQQMVATIVAHVRQGKRVLAVVGRTHAIMQAPALRHLLGTG